MPSLSFQQEEINLEENLNTRIEQLEKAKDDFQIWLSIFIATATLLIVINIGLSVWQVRFREPEDQATEEAEIETRRRLQEAWLRSPKRKDHILAGGSLLCGKGGSWVNCCRSG